MISRAVIHLRHLRVRVHSAFSQSATCTFLNARLNILPDPAFLDLKSALSERLERIAAGLQPEQFASMLDPLMCQTIEHGFAEAGADEGTVWLLDPADE